MTVRIEYRIRDKVTGGWKVMGADGMRPLAFDSALQARNYARHLKRWRIVRVTIRAKKPEKRKLTEDERKDLDLHHTIALVRGFNEMVKQATTLGEKAYYRLARDTYEKQFIELGGKIQKTETHTSILVIPSHVPELRFGEGDIALMRECIARYDGTP